MNRIPLVLLISSCFFGSVCKADFLERLETEKLWGVYQIHGYPPRFRAALLKQIELLGATPDFVMFFRDLPNRRGFPTESAEFIRKQGSIPVLSLELHQWSRGGRDQTDWLTAIIGGELDEDFRKWAVDAKAFASPVLLRFGFEMNGDWFSWGNQPEKFKQAWQRIHSVVKSAGADNVYWVFSPNVEWDKNKPNSRIKLYYPGDDYVDIVSLDGYNFGDHSKPWHSWQSFDSVFKESIDIISRYPKPLILGEIGCADGPGKAKWMSDFLNKFKEDPRLRGFIYYNFADGKNDEPNWRLNTDDATLNTFRDFVAD
ncbi:MAG: glycoside hydrolase family 26 protein [Opitutales bacterium]